MNKQQIVWGFAFTLISSITLASLPNAIASEREKQLSGSYEVTAATELKVESGVGTIEFKYHDKNTVEVEIIATVDEDDRWNNGDLSKAELVATQSGDRLRLEVPEQDDIQLDWVITMPAIAEIDADLGVGEVIGTFAAADFNLDLGVGDVDLDIDGAVATVKVDVGVGDSSVRGDVNTSTDRFLVTSSTKATGSGEARINIDVGVGDVTIYVNN
ncbi:hypothetical protein C9988_01045 [Pseudidiomarina aestuarii]|nr:hypothetical protein C9988_01045 [Pseudidiomarina aestuarii]